MPTRLTECCCQQSQSQTGFIRGIANTITALWNGRPLWLFHRKGIRRLIVDAARAKREVFDGLSVISPELKLQLRPSLLRQVNRLLILRVKTIRLAIIMSAVWFVLFWPRVHRLDALSQSLAGYWLLLSTLGAILLPTVIAQRLRVPHLTLLGVTAIWNALLVGVCTLWQPKVQEGISALIPVSAPAIEQSIALLQGIGAFMLAASVVSIHHTRLERAHSDALVIDRLLEALSILYANSHQWNELSVKRELLYELEAAASTLERDLPAHLQTGNRADDKWFRDTASQCAAALRNLKRWVLMPKADTRERILVELSNALVSLLRGNWDALPRARPLTCLELHAFSHGDSPQGTSGSFEGC